MTLARRMWMAASVCAGTLLAASSAFAQEGDARTVFANALFKWINFAIVVALVVWVFGKKLPPVFRRNAENISSAISSATAAKAKADAKLREVEERIAGLDRQIAALRAEAQRESAGDVERTRALTRSDQEKIAAAAKDEIAAAERAARSDLKELAARLAIDRAESQLAQELTPAVQESLLTGFVNSLDGRLN